VHLLSRIREDNKREAKIKLKEIKKVLQGKSSYGVLVLWEEGTLEKVLLFQEVKWKRGQ